MPDSQQMKIVTIIGARPQFIKAAAVSRAIASYNDQVNTSPAIEEILVHTGQHYDDGMSAIFFRELEIPEPKYNLNIGSCSHGKQTGQMLSGLEEVLLEERPDWVLIYGDTNSTLAGALAAAKLHIPIAHVEAGLRSFNRLMPEEINRIMSDHLSHLLLCPSRAAVINLAAEGITQRLKSEGKMLNSMNQGHAFGSRMLTPEVVLTGDVMGDALHFAVKKGSARSNILSRLSLQPQRYLLATVHRAENTDDPPRLNNILSAFAALNEPVVFPTHPRTFKLLQGKNYRPPGNVRLIDPIGYFDIIALEKSARLLLTDSGGMQKEAYWLKVPCITLRDETEWVETVDANWNILTGADYNRIIETVRTFKTPAEHPPLYGDGKAALYCLQAMLKY